MCDNIELPLALVMEEILKWEQPNKGGKETDEQAQEEKEE